MDDRRAVVEAAAEERCHDSVRRVYSSPLLVPVCRTSAHRGRVAPVSSLLHTTSFGASLRAISRPPVSRTLQARDQREDTVMWSTSVPITPISTSLPRSRHAMRSVLQPLPSHPSTGKPCTALITKSCRPMRPALAEVQAHAPRDLVWPALPYVQRPNTTSPLIARHHASSHAGLASAGALQGTRLPVCASSGALQLPTCLRRLREFAACEVEVRQPAMPRTHRGPGSTD